MIKIKKADESHVAGIAKVCSDGYWATYQTLFNEEYIRRIIHDFYNLERIRKEVSQTSKAWGGYFVALEENEVLGVIGGGMIRESAGEIFVLYINPHMRREGIGTMLLDALTRQQKEAFHATEQWVSVAKGNQKGIPFYESKGFIYVREQKAYGNSDEENYMSLRYYRKI